MGDSQSTTCIANGFVEEIQARVSVNKALYKHAIQEGGTNLKVSAGGQGVGIGAHGKTDIEYEHLQQLPGFVLIPPNDYLAFPMAGMDGQVFVTISAGKRNIANNYPVQNGRSIIIDANGYIKNAKPGKIWRDERGRKYSVKEPPAIKPVENEKIEDKKESAENEKKVENNNNKKEEIEEESNNSGDYITLPRPAPSKPRRKTRKSNTRKEKVEKEKKTKDEKDEKENEKEDEEEEEEEEEEQEEEEEEEDEEVDEEEEEEEEEQEEEEQDQNEEEEESIPEGKGIKITSFFDFFSKRSVSN